MYLHQQFQIQPPSLGLFTALYAMEMPQKKGKTMNRQGQDSVFPYTLPL
jgi:hypothetical protein